MAQDRKQAPEADRGDTVAQQQDKNTGGTGTPRTPNEHDTSADSQTGGQAAGQAKSQAAARDAASNRQDTDKGPEMDRVYNQEVREDAPRTAKADDRR